MSSSDYIIIGDGKNEDADEYVSVSEEAAAASKKLLESEGIFLQPKEGGATPGEKDEDLDENLDDMKGIEILSSDDDEYLG